MSKQPMSLENLPEQLKSQRESGDTGSILVNTGQIIDAGRESGFTRWSKKFAIAASICMALTLGGVLTYDSMDKTPNQYTVIVDTNQGTNLSQIISESGGQLVSITQRSDSTYEVTLISDQSRGSFLKWLRKNRDIKKAD